MQKSKSKTRLFRTSRLSNDVVCELIRQLPERVQLKMAQEVGYVTDNKIDAAFYLAFYGHVTSVSFSINLSQKQNEQQSV